ncbi:MAG: hypothetical protein HY000_26165 [Planctomycetes bacterium]|nr:hypothetical protein [Planctomycetota bacterium]
MPQARPRGSEFQVNTYTTNGQFSASAAMESNGDFVIAWESNGQDSGTNGIYAQGFGMAPEPAGNEFRGNTHTTSYQSLPIVATNSDGDFVIVWSSSDDQDGSGYGVYAQRYNSSGTAQGSEFLVNTYTTSNQLSTCVAMDADSDFVIVWRSLQDGDNYGVYAQRFNASGTAQGSEFRVNTTTTGLQSDASVAMDADGDFVVTWSSYQDGSGASVMAQRFGAGGTPRGELQVTTPSRRSGRRDGVLSCRSVYKVENGLGTPREWTCSPPRQLLV